MAPHLTPAELEFVFGMGSQGKSPAEVHSARSRKRSRQGLQAPTLKFVDIITVLPFVGGHQFHISTLKFDDIITVLFFVGGHPFPNRWVL